MIPEAAFAVNKHIVDNYFIILWSSKINANSLGVGSWGRLIRVLLDQNQWTCHPIVSHEDHFPRIQK